MFFVGVSLAWDRFWVLVEAIPVFVKLEESIFSALMESGRFFVSDEADRYFVSPPPPPSSEALRLLLGKIF